MIISLALLLLATASGTLISYLYDDRAAFEARVCSGVCIGLTVFGLVCFVFALFLGLTPITITIAAVVLLVPVVILRDKKIPQIIRQDLNQSYNTLRNAFSARSVGYTVFYVVTAVILWRCFQRAMLELPEGIYTGVLNNFGDLPFHISVISSFAYGNNYPPEDPTYTGVKFTYPFLTDFISAVFLRCGASLRASMFIPNFAVALAFVGVLHRWGWVMLRDKIAALLTPVLVILNGGFGFVLFLQALNNRQGSFTDFLKSLPVSFTIIPETTWRWGNAISTLLIPQRGFLLGLPIAVLVFTQWWLATSDDRQHVDEPPSKSKSKGKKHAKERAAVPSKISSVHQMIAAGVITGLLPLVHAHSFVAVMVVGAGIAILQWRWRVWFAFFVAASIIALPQMVWSTYGSAVKASTFFELQYGWDHGNENALWFWLKNTGLFIPLIVAALLWRNEKRLVSQKLLFFFLPFTICFVVPNVLKLAPWIWDNVKVLFYWWVGSAPLVALLLARLWRDGAAKKAVAVVLLVCLTLAGALDVASILLRPTKHQIFDARGIAFAESIKSSTQPRTLIMHAPVHTHPVFLTGRRSLMGYPGHIWTHGLDFAQRETEIKKVYSGMPDAVPILRRYGVQYVVVGPHERNLMRINEQFFSRFPIAGETGEYRLYKVAP